MSARAVQNPQRPPNTKAVTIALYIPFIAFQQFRVVVNVANDLEGCVFQNPTQVNIFAIIINVPTAASPFDKIDIFRVFSILNKIIFKNLVIFNILKACKFADSIAVNRNSKIIFVDDSLFIVRAVRPRSLGLGM